MFYYHLGSIVLMFECLSESACKWRLTLYKVGTKGGWKLLGTNTRIYTEGYTALQHLKDYRKKRLKTV